MIDLYRWALRQIRQDGFDVFVLPVPNVSVSGEAFLGGGGERCINIVGPVHSMLWLFVLFHEVAHHALCHTSGGESSVPEWIKEYSVDMAALDLIYALQPYAANAFDRAASDHIRPLLQRMIDIEVWHHVDLDIARWAGCLLPPDAERFCAPTRGEADEDEITF